LRVLIIGLRVLTIGLRVIIIGLRVMIIGLRVLIIGLRALIIGVRVLIIGLRVLIIAMAVVAADEWNQLGGGRGRCRVPERHTVGHRGLEKVALELSSSVVVQFENSGGVCTSDTNVMCPSRRWVAKMLAQQLRQRSTPACVDNRPNAAVILTNRNLLERPSCQVDKVRKAWLHVHLQHLGGHVTWEQQVVTVPSNVTE
jgi:hypothetical protein